MKSRLLSYGLTFFALLILALVITGCSVNIISPGDNSTVEQGDPIEFKAEVIWYAQDDIDELEWSSSIDGILGTGGTLNIPDLSAGRASLSVGRHDIFATFPEYEYDVTARDHIRLTVNCKEPSDVVDRDIIPQFVCANYIELDEIYRISKFRSSVGHDSSDDFESCRSMKHYFQPKGSGEGWSSVKIFSPVNGTVFRTMSEWAGTKIEITPDGYPDFRIAIFHVNLINPLSNGQRLVAGQKLGTHFSSDTYSDIEVVVDTPNGMKKISYFEVMTDALFQHYRVRGLSTRKDTIISKWWRDRHPLFCDDGEFTNRGLEFGNWVNLN